MSTATLPAPTQSEQAETFDALTYDATNVLRTVDTVAQGVYRWRYQGCLVMEPEEMAAELLADIAQYAETVRGFYTRKAGQDDEEFIKFARINLMRWLRKRRDSRMEAEISEARRWRGGYRRPGWEAADEEQFTAADCRAFVEAVWDDTILEHGLPDPQDPSESDAEFEVRRKRESLTREVMRGVKTSKRDPRQSTDFVTRVIAVVDAWHKAPLKDEWREAVEAEMRDGLTVEAQAKKRKCDRRTVERLQDRCFKGMADWLNGRIAI